VSEREGARDSVCLCVIERGSKGERVCVCVKEREMRKSGRNSVSVCLRVRKRERFVDCLFITQLCCCSIVESNVKKLSRFQVEKKRGRRKMALKEEIIFKQNFGRKKALFRQIYHKSISVFMFFSVKWSCIAIRL